MNWRKIRRWFVAVCLVGLVASYFIVRSVGDRLLAPTNHPVGPPPADLPVVALTIPSDSGSNLAAWYVAAPDSRATVVLVHGIRADRRSMLSHARLFHDAGYAVVLIDLQAHGESPGEHVTVGYLERHDVRAAVKFAREKDPGNRVAVVGVSLGGAATVLAAPLDIDAAVLESVFPTIQDAVHNRIAIRLGVLAYVAAPILISEVSFRSGVSACEICPIDHIAEIGCPILIAAGDADKQTPLNETERLYNAARAPKQLIIFHGAGHIDLLDFDPDQYKREVLPFLAKHLLAP